MNFYFLFLLKYLRSAKQTKLLILYKMLQFNIKGDFFKYNKIINVFYYYFLLIPIND